ncbi:hypothetical protein BBW65_05680 [Helicobacter enhydrae]|uniref:Uncharacterized protein n=2 Tax=Helicobacter enhydrae TaxID=222136 RepID=A0A1B1U6C8_9HELI|nr:hypothetical protein BBW65_05680 [Helicobacter enhydrae]
MLDNTQAYTQEGFIVSNSNIMLLQNYSLEVIGVWKGKNIKSIHKYLRADSSSKVEIEIFSNCRFFLLIRDAKSLGVLIYTLTIMMLQCFDNQNYPTPLGKAIECFIDKLLNVGLL